MAQALDVSPHALDVPDIDSYIGLMHTLFTLEDLYGLTVSEADGEICLKVNKEKGKNAHELLKCSMLGKSRRTSYLPKKSAGKNTITGVTTIRSSIPHRDGQKYPHRNLVTLWLKCSKTNSNQINKDDKKPLAMSFIPTAKGLVYNMDLFVAQPPVNHSLTAKPLDYKNNGSLQLLSICYQKTS